MVLVIYLLVRLTIRADVRKRMVFIRLLVHRRGFGAVANWPVIKLVVADSRTTEWSRLKSVLVQVDVRLPGRVVVIRQYASRQRTA